VRVVVDTNVIVYYLLGTEPFVDEVKAFWKTVTEPIAPASWEAEVANVLWMSVRAKIVTLAEAVTRLDYAIALGIEAVPVTSLWKGALAKSAQKTVAVYDTLFVELAEREAIPMATFDTPVLKAFPAIAKKPHEIAAKKPRAAK
jgi:predicted nucleic acid-binding protein